MNTLRTTITNQYFTLTPFLIQYLTKSGGLEETLIGKAA